MKPEPYLILTDNQAKQTRRQAIHTALDAILETMDATGMNAGAVYLTQGPRSFRLLFCESDGLTECATCNGLGMVNPNESKP